MVGSDMLLLIHRRLCDIMATDDPFGGVSLLAVGDLLQLPPVGQKPVFVPPSDEPSAIYGSLWQNHFKIIELEEIQRQKYDHSFACLLNRLRVGHHTDEDIQVLQQRQTDPDSTDYPVDSPHIFAYNKDVNKHNVRKLEDLEATKYTFKSQDSKKDLQTGRVDTSTLKEMSGGLPTTVTLAVGARVMLTKNLDVQDGLVNSATGVVTGFYPQPDPVTSDQNFKPKYVLIKFDDSRVGKVCRQQSRGILRNETSTPISTVESLVRLGRHSKVTARRVQFPLCLAWAVTIHKEQGKTEDSLVVSCSGTFHVGKFYTAVSRTKDLSGLHILGKITPNKIKVNKTALEEIERMKRSSFFVPVQNLTMQLSVSFDNFLKIQCLNINSLAAHMQSFKKDSIVPQSQITCLVETWLKQPDPTPEFTEYSFVRNDSQEIRRHRSGGMLTYLHQDLHLVKQYSVSDTSTEHQIIILSPKQCPALRFCILLVYHNPKVSSAEFCTQLERLISVLPMGLPSIVSGDFNIDMSKDSTEKRKFIVLLQYYGFQPHFTVPTHCRGGHLDNFFIIFQSDFLSDVIPKHYSDYFLLSLAIQWNAFNRNM